MGTQPQVGPYIAIRLLGTGGTGEVWMAEDPKLARPVALKRLRATDDPGALARFRREALILARLRHPNIAVLYGYGVEGNRPWLAMQLVEGEPLDRARPRDAREAARILRDAARGVAYAHAHGVVHRDLKPGNVMISPDGRVTVMDFGLARGAAGAVTEQGTIVGTPAFMPPEQAHAEAPDPRSDVYALGATLYDLLTGGPPFRGDTVEILTQVMAGCVEPPGRRAPGLDAALETLVLRCMEKDPARRYPTALSLADDLDRWLATGTISSHPARPTRVRRRSRRSASTVVIAAACALAAVMLLASRRDHATDALLARVEAEAALFGSPAHRAARARARATLQELEERRPAPLVAARARWAVGDIAGADRALDATDPDSAEVARLRARVRLERFWRHPAGLVARHGYVQRRDILPGLWRRLVDALRASESHPSPDPVDRALVLMYLHEDPASACGLLERETSVEAAFWMARWTMSCEWQDRAVVPGPRCVDALVDRAYAAILRGDYDSAIADADRAASAQPDHVGAAYARAQVHYSRSMDLFCKRRLPVAREEVSEAIVRFEAVDALEPRSPWPAMFRARLLFEDCTLGDHDRGMPRIADELGRAIELEPDLVPARLQRILMYLQMERADLALPDVERLLAIAPGGARVQLAAGCVKAFVRGRQDEAIAHLDRALRSGDEPGLVYFRRAQAHLFNASVDAAIADFTRAVECGWEVGDGYHMLGRARAGRGEHAAAVRDYDAALEAKPSRVESYFWRAQSRATIGDLEGAESDCTVFLGHQPENAEGLYMRAHVRSLRSDTAGALADLERALAVAPRDWSRRPDCERQRKALRSQP